jgi:hypothetical protein
MTLWRFGRDDLPAVLLILLLPIAVAAPQLLEWVKADPMLYTGQFATGLADGYLPGRAYIDPNHGFGTQALGYRAALEWVGGRVPWWNPYSGVGLPLAAEYQPAAFFPLVFLLLLPHGVIALQLALQILGGLGTYALLRQLGVGRFAAATGGVLYAFNGTLAWFAHAPALPVPFLPWLLLGIERARAAALLGAAHGWRVLALAMAMSLLAGFPETAYIGGLLALAWTLVRGAVLDRPFRKSYAKRIAIGGAIGIAIAAPQVIPFFQFLVHAAIGSHHDFSHAALNPESAIQSFVAPYAYGPIFAYMGHWPLLGNMWGGIGGYVTVALLASAAYGAAVRRDALSWLLVGWIVLAAAKTYRIEPAVTLWNLVPGISIAAFARYVQPSWQLAMVILAAWGLDNAVRNGGPVRGPWRAATAFTALVLAAAIAYGTTLWPHVSDSVALRNWALGSAAWAALSALACIALIRAAARPRARVALAALLAFDAMLMFAIPSLSNPRSGTVDMPAIRFLQANLGLQRFYTLGPIQPNYGAYFGIASINHNYLPVSRRWVEWVRENLDRAADDVVFNGEAGRAPRQPTPADELRRNLANYQWAGVKYVVAYPGTNPLPPGTGAHKVYADTAMEIHELPEPKPYFEAIAGECALTFDDRLGVATDCRTPATLVRRELHFPGWTATVNGGEAAIDEYRGLFQAVELPAGRSTTRFDYAPAGVGWSWFVSLVALAALLLAGRKR